MPVLRFLARSVASTLAGIAIALVLTSCATAAEVYDNLPDVISE